MASKRDIKKYFKDQANLVADELYTPLTEGGKELSKKADALLDKTADLLDEYANSVGTYPKKNKAAISKYFDDLKFEFDKKLDEIKEQISSL